MKSKGKGRIVIVIVFFLRLLSFHPWAIGNKLLIPTSRINVVNVQLKGDPKQS